jgi:hypothetical protein
VLGLNGVGGMDGPFITLIKRLRRAASLNGLLTGRQYREFGTAMIGRISATFARNCADQFSRHLTSSGESSQVSALATVDSYWQRYSAVGSSAHFSSTASSGASRTIRPPRRLHVPPLTRATPIATAAGHSPLQGSATLASLCGGSPQDCGVSSAAD